MFDERGKGMDRRIVERRDIAPLISASVNVVVVLRALLNLFDATRGKGNTKGLKHLVDLTNGTLVVKDNAHAQQVDPRGDLGSGTIGIAGLNSSQFAGHFFPGPVYVDNGAIQDVVHNSMNAIESLQVELKATQLELQTVKDELVAATTRSLKNRIQVDELSEVIGSAHEQLLDGQIEAAKNILEPHAEGV